MNMKLELVAKTLSGSNAVWYRMYVRSAVCMYLLKDGRYSRYGRLVQYVQYVKHVQYVEYVRYKRYVQHAPYVRMYVCMYVCMYLLRPAPPEVETALPMYRPLQARQSALGSLLPHKDPEHDC